MVFEKPILTVENNIDEQSDVISTSDAEKTSTYDEVWTTWLESNI